MFFQSNSLVSICNASLVYECPKLKRWPVRDVGVQKPCRYGTSGHGLAGTVVLGSQLDLMILEVFSNLNDSMILCTDLCIEWGGTRGIRVDRPGLAIYTKPEWLDQKVIIPRLLCLSASLHTSRWPGSWLTRRLALPCRDGWLCHGGWLRAVQIEAQRRHENVASPDSHARGSPGLRRGSDNVW